MPLLGQGLQRLCKGVSVAAAPAVAGGCLAAAAVGSDEDAVGSAGFCSHHAAQRPTLYSTTQSGLEVREALLPTRCSSSLAAVALGSRGEKWMNTRRSDLSMLLVCCSSGDGAGSCCCCWCAAAVVWAKPTAGLG